MHMSSSSSPSSSSPSLTSFSLTSSSAPRDAQLPVGVSSHRHPRGAVLTIVLHRPTHRNAVDGPIARALYSAFCDAEADPTINAIVLYGAGGTFCAGADLTAISRAGRGGEEAGGVADADPSSSAANPLTPVRTLQSHEDQHSVEVRAHTSDIGPMGPTRLELTKPVIAAIAGHAVAGGLELACWADMRVAESNAVFGVFCRRFGVPLIDGGTVRLPRLIGQSRAMDMILTGRAVNAQEALSIGLINRVVAPGTAREAAEALAIQLAAFPQRCLRADRWSLLHQHNKPTRLALEHEFAHARHIVAEESIKGATRFAQGQGKHGRFKGGDAQLTSHTASTSLSSAAAVSSPSPSPSSPSMSSPSAPSSSSISPAIRCVLFDLGGVVVDSPVAAILAYEHELALPRHSLNVLLGRSPLFHQLERGEVSLEQFIPLFEAEVAAVLHRAREGGRAAEVEGLARFDARVLFQHMGSVKLRDPMLSAIRSLRSRGLIVGAVTNNWKDRACDTRGNMMSGEGGLDSLFDFVVESCVVGVRKPDTRIFEVARQKAQEEMQRRARGRGCSGHTSREVDALRPAEIVFLDDLGKNLSSARKTGMHTIKVEANYGAALQQLADITGVPIDGSKAPQAQTPANAGPAQKTTLQLPRAKL